MAPRNIIILEPQVVLTDILKGRKMPATGKRRRNNKKLVPPTTRRTRSAGLDGKDDIPLITHELSSKISAGKKIVPKRRKTAGRPLSKVKWNKAVDAILRNKDNVVRADGQLAPSHCPVWTGIKREMDNKITVETLYRIAEKDMYKLLIGDPDDVITNQTAITADVKEAVADREDDETDETLEEFTPPRVHGEAAAATAPHQERNQDETLLLFVEPNRGRGNSAGAAGQQTNRGDGNNNVTSYEEILSNLVKSIDCLNKEIKGLTRELRERNNLTERGARRPAAHTVITCGCSTR